MPGGRGPAIGARGRGERLCADSNMAPPDVKMSDRRQELQSQRVVAADEVDDRLRSLVALLRAIGHDVVAAETGLGAVREAIEEAGADLAVVAVHGEPSHAL